MRRTYVASRRWVVWRQPYVSGYKIGSMAQFVAMTQKFRVPSEDHMLSGVWQRIKDTDIENLNNTRIILCSDLFINPYT